MSSWEEKKKILGDIRSSNESFSSQNNQKSGSWWEQKKQNAASNVSIIPDDYESRVNSFNSRIDAFNRNSQSYINSYNTLVGQDKYSDKYQDKAQKTNMAGTRLKVELDSMRKYLEDNPWMMESDDDFKKFYAETSKLLSDTGAGLDEYEKYWREYANQNVQQGADGRGYDMSDEDAWEQYLKTYQDAEAQAKQDRKDARKEAGLFGRILSNSALVNQAPKNIMNEKYSGYENSVYGRDDSARAKADNLTSARENVRATRQARMDAEANVEYLKGNKALAEKYAPAYAWYTEESSSGKSSEQIYQEALKKYEDASNAYSSAFAKAQSDDMYYAGFATDDLSASVITPSKNINGEDVVAAAAAKDRAEAELHVADEARFKGLPIHEGDPGYDPKILENGRTKTIGLYAIADRASEDIGSTITLGDMSAGYALFTAAEAMKAGAKHDIILDPERVSEDEYNTWLYLLGSKDYGIAYADEYALAVNNNHARQQRLERQESVARWFTEDLGSSDSATAREFWRGVAGSIYGAVAPAFTGVFDYTYNAAEYAATGDIREKSYLTPMQAGTIATSAIADTLNRRYGTIDDDAAVLGGKGLGDLYQVGESIIQSWASIAAGGEVGSLAMFFFSAGAQGIYDALDRGIDPGKAIALGTLNGLAEVAGEVISVEGLVNNFFTPSHVEHLFLNVLKQAGYEGSEEVLTSLLNGMADEIVNRDKSELKIAMQQYLSTGMSYDEASRQATKDFINSIASDALSGVLSGFAPGAIGAVKNVSYKAAQRAAYGNAQAFDSAGTVAEAKSLGDAKLEAQAKKAEARGTMTNRQQARMERRAERIAEKQNNQNRITAIENRLTELGETGPVTSIARAIDKNARGIKLNEEDVAAATMSPYFTKVLGEVNYGTSRWTQDIKQRDLYSERYERAVNLAGTKDDPLVNNFGVENKNATVDLNGSPATLVGVELGENDNVEAVFRMADGIRRNVQLEDAVKALPKELGEFVHLLGGKGAQAQSLFDNYQNGQSVGFYLYGMENVSNVLARAGVSKDLITGTPGAPSRFSAMFDKLTPAQIDYAYKIGSEARQAAVNAAKAVKSGKRNGTVSFEGGEIDGVKYKAVDAAKRKGADIDYVGRIAKTLGVDVVFFQSEADNRGFLKGANGAYKDGVIYLDINAGMKKQDVGERMLLTTMAHELTHYFQDQQTEKYEELKKYISEYLLQTEGVSFNSLVASKVSRDTSGTLTKAGAIDEVIADACETMLKNSTAMEQLAQENPELHKSLLDFIRDFLQKILDKISGVHTEAKALEQNKDVYDTVQKMWDELFVASAQHTQTETEQKKTPARKETEGKAQYEERDFGDQVDEIRAGTFDILNHAYMGTTPPRLSEILGLPKIPMLVTPSHVRDMSVDRKTAMKMGLSPKGHYHGLGWNNVKNLPYDMNKPVLIIKSTTDKSDASFVVFVNRKDSNGYPVMVAVKPNGLGNYFNLEFHENAFLSGYGRKNYQNYVATAKTENRILYAYKNSQKNNYTPGVQFSDNIMFSDYSENLSQFKDIVKEKFKDTTFKERRGLLPQFSERDAQYDEAVNSGNMDTAQRLVDEAAKEAGYTVRAYHGTPNGTFTVFRGWQYFTQDKQYADVYQNQGASSNGYKKTALNPKTYDVYINPGKVFDTRKAKERRIFQNEFFGKWGNGTPLSEKGLPDWTDADDIIEFFEENDYDYDTILIDEGATGGYGDEVKSRGISYVVKSPSQIKSRDAVVYDDSGNIVPLSERFDSGNQDIRFSERDVDTSDLTKAELEAREMTTNQLKAENAMLKRTVDRLKKQTKLTKERTVRIEDATKLAKETINRFGSQMDPKELAKVLKQMGDYLVQTDGADIDYEFLRYMANDTARKVLDINKEIENGMDGTRKDLGDYLKGQKLFLPKEYFADMGDISDFRKRYKGVIRLTKDGLAVDVAYQELTDMLGEGFFPSDISNPADQLQRIADVWDSVQPTYGNPFQKDLARMTEELTQDIIWDVISPALRETAPTYADKAKAREAKMRSDAALKLQETKEKDRTRLEELRAEKNERIEQLKKQASERLQAAVAKEKAKKYEKITAVREHYKKKEASVRDNRKKSEIKAKIFKTVNRLDSLYNRGTKEKNVKLGLQGLVSAMLDSANALTNEYMSNEDMVRAGIKTDLTSSEKSALDAYSKLLSDIGKAQENLEKASSEMAPNSASYADKIDSLRRKISAVEKTLSSVFERERNRIYGMGIDESVRKVAAKYKALENSEYDYAQNAYDDGVFNRLSALSESTSGTLIRDMSVSQLQELLDAYTMIAHTVSTANKLFGIEKARTVEEAGEATMREVRSLGGNRKYISNARKVLTNLGYKDLKPVYFFDMVGSDTMNELFNSVRGAEDKAALIIDEARRYRAEQVSRFGADAWDMDKQYTFESAAGNEFQLTLGTMMSLYAYFKREQAAYHLEHGGFVLDDSIEITEKKRGIPVKYSVNTKDAFRILANTTAEIFDNLSSEQKAYVDAMQQFMVNELADYGNEVTRALYGINGFKDQNYFPIKSSKQFVYEQNMPAGEHKIKNSGFTKDVVPYASNPIVLQDFDTVWAQHCYNMAMYAAFTLPVENMNRVVNYHTAQYKLNDTEESRSVKATIASAYGEAANEYIKQFLTDVNGGAFASKSAGFMNKLIGKFKKSATLASASVVVQQYSSVARAMAVIDPKYFTGKSTNNGSSLSEKWETIKKYAPVAIIKDMGYFDNGMGRTAQEYILTREYRGLEAKAKAFITDSDFRDEVLGKGPEIMDQLGWVTIWNAAYRQTKANNQNLSGEELNRETAKLFNEAIVKTQVYDSVISRSEYMRSTDTAVKMATSFLAEPTTTINMLFSSVLHTRRGDKAKAARVTGAVITSLIFNAALQAIVFAARDDDDDKTYAEKYLASVSSSLIDNLNVLNMLPYIRDIMSIVEGYSVERSDMSIVEDLIKGVKVLGNDKKTPWEKFYSFVGSVCNLFGIPLKNIMRDGKAVYNTIDGIAHGEEGTFAGAKYAIREGITGKATSDDEQLYQAYLDGDEKQFARVSGRYENEKKIKSALKKVLKQHFLTGDITEEEVNQYLVDTGVSDDDDDAYWMVKEWANSGAEESWSKYKPLYDATLSGDSVAYNSALEELISHGEKEKEIMSGLKKQIHKWYVGDDNGTRSIKSRPKCEEILKKFAGLSEKDARDQVSEWNTEVSAPEKIPYDDIGEEFIAGNITAYRASEMRQRYGGQSKQAADAQVLKWQCEKDTGIAYDEIREAFETGKITAERAIAMRQKYGGKTEKDALAEVMGWKYFEWDTNGNGTITQAEAFENLKNLPDSEADAIWTKFGWSTSWEKYKSKNS